MIGITVDAGEGCPIIEKVQERTKRINSTTFTRGDYAIAVRWLHRYPGDEQKRTYVLDAYEGDSHDVVNSTELQKIQMPQAPVPSKAHSQCTAHCKCSAMSA